MLYKKTLYFALLSIIATQAFSNNNKVDSKYFEFIAGLGYTNYQNMYQHDGQTPLLRIAMNKPLYFGYRFNYGIELGVQTGNSMRLNISQRTLDTIGGLQVQTTIKPLIDLLVSTKIHILESPYNLIIKGGAAYRQWQFYDRCYSLNQFAGEVQSGVGYQINKTVQLSLLYQGIYGASPNFTVNTHNQTSFVSNIPIQHGVLINFSYFI